MNFQKGLKLDVKFFPFRECIIKNWCSPAKPSPSSMKGSNHPSFPGLVPFSFRWCSHSSTLKLPGREDFHRLSDFCDLFCWISGVFLVGCETSLGTTVGLEEDVESEKRDCINPLTEGERKICGRTRAGVVESVSGSDLFF